MRCFRSTPGTHRWPFSGQLQEVPHPRYTGAQKLHIQRIKTPRFPVLGDQFLQFPHISEQDVHQFKMFHCYYFVSLLKRL